MNNSQLHELLLQGLETERGGVRIYETAIRCAVNDEFREELAKYHEQTIHHVELMEGVALAFGLDLEAESAGRSVVRSIGESLVAAMELALEAGPPAAAQLVAAECVTLAETKDHLNWELIGEVLTRVHGDEGKALRDAHGEAEEQEDEHLYHSTGWGRELWLDALGVPAVLPPPEERKSVTTEIGAARAKQQREDMT